jgi:large subunit ribosomal protein L25
MDAITLTVEPRTTLGKQVKHLYRSGKAIGILYGKGKESMPVQADYETVRKVYTAASRNHPIELTIDGAGKHLVLIREVDHDPVSGRLRHVSFHEVSRHEKVDAEVPVELVGTAPAVLAGNIILTLNDHVDVSANPTNLPGRLEASAELLKEPDDIVTVADLKVPANVEITTEPDTPLFKVEVPRSQVEEQREEAAEAEAEAGEKPAES